MRALFALFVRSLREDARARLPPILRAALILVILLILWANESDFARRTAPGREFLGMVLFANLGLIAIAAPGIFASAITEEKEDQTLMLLRMTRLSPLAILLGKSTTRLLGALLLLAVQIPFTLLAVTLGGVSTSQVLSAYAVLCATTFLLCNLALLCSVVCRNGIRAGVCTGAVCALVFVVLPIVCIATSLRRLNFGSLVPVTAWAHFSTRLVESNPAYTLSVLLFKSSKAAPITSHVATNLVAGTACFLVAWLVFDRFCAGGEEIAASGRKRKGWRIFSRRRPRPSVRRPVAWKDFHFLNGGWRGMLLRLAVCALLFFAVYAFMRWVDESSPQTAYFWRNVGEGTMNLGLCAFALDASLTASRTFGEERRHLTLHSLATLPKSTYWLIWQKILGCIPSLLPTAALFLTGVWIRLTVAHNDYADWMHFFHRNDGEILYVLSQVLLLPILITNLSLRMRRGAMPTGIAVVVALNVLTVVLLDAHTRMSDDKKLILAASVSTLAAVLLAIGIHRRIPAAAAQ
jgi:ABC-type transport system involved in multi-copper enzyme maturation permease subunit